MERDLGQTVDDAIQTGFAIIPIYLFYYYFLHVMNTVDSVWHSTFPKILQRWTQCKPDCFCCRPFPCSWSDIKTQKTKINLQFMKRIGNKEESVLSLVHITYYSTSYVKKRLLCLRALIAPEFLFYLIYIYIYLHFYFAFNKTQSIHLPEPPTRNHHFSQKLRQDEIITIIFNTIQ